jgi:hypothetical protein
MESASGPAVHFINVEYFFRLLYELVVQARSVSFQGDLLQLASQIWLLATAISLIVSVGLLIVFVNAVLRYHQTLKDEEPRYATIHPAEAEEERDHSRWAHIRTLVEGPNESEWRQAIIEADIMLDDLLSQLGYPGQSVGEKLKAVNPERFHSLQHAWEAHKVRNEIAHSGSAFQLTERLAHRTIAQYEVVMREHGEI